jgi:hypothetical protein
MRASDVLASGADSLPGVKLLGLVIGILLVIAAIRAMFGRKR